MYFSEKSMRKSVLDDYLVIMLLRRNIGAEVIVVKKKKISFYPEELEGFNVYVNLLIISLDDNKVQH